MARLGRPWWLLAIAVLVLCRGALGQEEVAFPAAPSQRLPLDQGVNAILTLPPGSAEKVPAVVLIHSSGGYDEAQYAFYGSALRAAGIATLELVLFRSPDHRIVPSHRLPQAFGALRYLANHPRIDPRRIGITGFSLGGVLSMLSASEILADEHLPGGPRFAAHVPVYPVCWVHEGAATRAERIKRFWGVYDKLTGAPVHILAGAKDEVDHPDGCQRFVNALLPDMRKLVSVTVFPDATHSWDVGRSYTYFDRGGCLGKGCQVQVVSDADIAQKGREIMADFFVMAFRHVGEKKPKP